MPRRIFFIFHVRAFPARNFKMLQTRRFVVEIIFPAVREQRGARAPRGRRATLPCLG